MQLTSSKPRNAYDHLLRQLIVETGDLDLAQQFSVPASTARSWVRRTLPNVISPRELHRDASAAIVEAQCLRKKVAVLATVVGLLVALLRAIDLKLDDARLPEGQRKRRLLRAVERAQKHMPRSHALRVLRISPARLHAWKAREQGCALDDKTSCPRSVPARATARERFAIKTMALSTQLAHLPIRALALLAQRQGIVLLAAETWGRIIRQHGWRRPRARVHPRPPTVGLRAERPGQYLHIDVTVIRLLDGTRAFVQAVIDNYSRLILAHNVCASYDGSSTAALLRKAFLVLRDRPGATLFSDDGTENRGPDVEQTLGQHGVTHLIAQCDVLWSNSMIEAFWRSMKHNFLYLQRLDSLAALTRFVDAYVLDHNELIPHSAFRGQTPAEVFRETATDLATDLKQQRADARVARLAENRRAYCEVCPAMTPPTELVP